MAPQRILYCHCAFAQVVPPETKGAVLEQLSASELSFEAVPDLCEMSARRDPALPGLAAGGATIVACYPRAVKWLFNAAGAPLSEHVRIVNMRELAVPDVLTAIGLSAATEETS